MYFFRNKRKGSVCIVLSLLMLPLYSFALGCTDGVKITSAGSIAEKAVQLGLTAGMSDYNAVLQKTYGLFAVSETQKSDDDMEKCFEGSLPTKTSAAAYNNFITFENENVTASYPEYAVLANPDILKYQISQIMKYEEISGLSDTIISVLKDGCSFSDEMNRISDDELNAETVKDEISEKEALDFFIKLSAKKESPSGSDNSDLSDSDKSRLIIEEKRKIEELFGKSEKTDFNLFFFDDSSDDEEREKKYENFLNISLDFTEKLFSSDVYTELTDDFLTAEYIMKKFSCKNDDNGEKCRNALVFSKGNNVIFGNETEYILFGSDNISENAVSVRNSIYSVRFLMNTIYVYNDRSIRSAAKIAAAAASLLTEVPEKVYETLFLLSYAAAESDEDTEKILSGERIPFYKSKSDICIKLPWASSDDNEGISINLFFDYRDYLEIFILFALQSEKRENDILTRTASVIGTNMKYGLSDYKRNGSTDFEITRAYTVLELSADLSTDTMILGLFDKSCSGKKKNITIKKRRSF